jgi:hypothetical protein
MVLIGALKPVLGQQKRPDVKGGAGGGQIENTQIVFEKNKQILLPLTEREFSTDGQQVRIDSSNLKQPLDPSPGLPLQNKLDIKPKVALFASEGSVLAKQNYLRLGVGNFATTHAELFYGSGLRDKAEFSLLARHFNSALGSDKFGAQGRNQIIMRGGYEAGKGVLSGELEYDLRRHYFYGVLPPTDVDRSSVKQNINRTRFGIAYNRITPKAAIQLKAGVQNTNTTSGIAETHVSFTPSLEVPVGKQLSGIAHMDYNFTNLTMAGKRSRAYVMNSIGVRYYTTEEKKLELRPQIALLYENDTADKANIHFYPSIYGRYKASPTIAVYGQAGGQAQFVTASDMLNRLPWLSDTGSVSYLNTPFRLLLGSDINLGNGFDLGVSFNYATYKNYSYLQTAPKDSAKFRVAQDSRLLSEISVGATLAWVASSTDKLTTGITIRSISNGDLGAVPYYSPVLVDFGYERAFTPKLTGRVGLNLQSPMWAYRAGDRAKVRLGLQHDLQLGVKYQATERISGFIQLYNLANNRNFIAYNYRARGVLALVGASLHF